MNSPVIDLHCDLLHYLLEAQADPFKKDAIGCSFPSLKEGNVKLQVMAIFASTEKGSAEIGLKQSLIFKNMFSKYSDQVILSNETAILNTLSTSAKIGVLAAIENASGFCEEDEPIETGLKRLEKIIHNTERILYIGMTHHLENRFGGGNATKVGLKEDGKVLLNYITGKKIALDFSHTSDPLAFDILDHISKNNLDIPIIASHSNYRKVFDHPRNLPDEIAIEIIKRKGLIGVNFLRAFLNNQDPNAIYDHILYGINLGGTHSICFGADYFFTDHHPDQSRRPFFYKEQENAGCYPALLKNLTGRVSPEVLEGIASKNAVDFIRRIWN